LTIASFRPDGAIRDADTPPRIGACGHRLDRLAGLALEPIHHQAAAVLTLLTVPPGATHPPRTPPVVITELAEGADRIIAHAAIAAGATLHAILPFDRDEYAHDFPTAESRAEYRQLLAAAAEVVELPGSRATPESMIDAYAAAGDALLDRSQVLVAIWNGLPGRGPGGTTDLVQAALRRGLPVVWIASAPPHAARVVAPLPGTAPNGPFLARLAALDRIADPTGAPR